MYMVYNARCGSAKCSGWDEDVFRTVLRVIALRGTTQPCLTRTNTPRPTTAPDLVHCSTSNGTETTQSSSCTKCLYRAGRVHTVSFLLSALPPQERIPSRSVSSGCHAWETIEPLFPGDGGLDPAGPDKGGRLRQELFLSNRRVVQVARVAANARAE